MFDVIIIGGSYAGLSAALQVARARRKVLVIDAGSRRNRFASESHGFLTQDGVDPSKIAAEARSQLMKYPTVTWVEGTAKSVTGQAGEFVVDGHVGKRVILAAGVTDELPEIPGVRERWGTHVFHCPYCHGYELGGKRTAVIATMSLSVMQAILLREWGPTTYVTRGLFEPTAEELVTLEKRDIQIERAPLREITGDADLAFDDGRVLSFAGLFVGTRLRITTPIVAQLGLALEDGHAGPYIKVDVMKETSVPGVYACGDIAVAGGTVATAVGDGARAGFSAHQSLIFR